MVTSRALVAAVPDHEVTRISFSPPPLNDFRLSIEVAPVSTRKRITADPTRTFTTGRRSHRSMGISSDVAGSLGSAMAFCAGAVCVRTALGCKSGGVVAGHASGALDKHASASKRLAKVRVHILATRRKELPVGCPPRADCHTTRHIAWNRAYPGNL